MMRRMFVTVIPREGEAETFGPFWTYRARRRWLNEYEELHLGSDYEVVVR